LDDRFTKLARRGGPEDRPGASLLQIVLALSRWTRPMAALDTFFRKIPQVRPGSARAYLLAVALVALATIVRLAPGELFKGVQFITYFPAVILISLICGMAAGWLGVVLSALAAWGFVYSPAFGLSDSFSVAFFGAVATIDVLIIGALRNAVANVRRLNRMTEINEQKFRSIVESSPEAMVIVDVNGTIALVNAQTEAMFGYRREELVGRPVETLVPKRLAERHRRNVARFAGEARARPMGAGIDLYALRKDGTEFPVEISLSPLHTPEGMLVSSVIRDITARRQIENELSGARQKEHAASRAKTAFLSNMSHELRTPLNAVIGFAQLLEADRSGALSPKQREYAGFIHQGGHHLLQLVNEVLDLSTIEAGRLNLSIAPVAAHEALTVVQRGLMPLAVKAGVELILRPTDGLADTLADKVRLHQCLTNLVSNAIKYNRPGGSVILEASSAPGGCIRYSVADTGVGIPTERQSQLFQPFQRLGAEHTHVEGTGLGLALTQRLVEAMGGRMGFTSEPGRGSRFWIDLPAQAASAAPAEAEEGSKRPPVEIGPGSHSALYVEDNAMSARLIEAVLAAMPDFTVFGAATGQEGIALAIERRPDVILLDIDLPDMNGYEVLARLREMPETRDIPVLALTAAALPGDVTNGLAAGFFRYLTKPLDAAAFHAAIRDALAEAVAA
jgi:protein-histidine pros-kinase